MTEDSSKYILYLSPDFDEVLAVRKVDEDSFNVDKNYELWLDAGAFKNDISDGAELCLAYCEGGVLDKLISLFFKQTKCDIYPSERDSNMYLVTTEACISRAKEMQNDSGYDSGDESSNGSKRYMKISDDGQKAYLKCHLHDNRTFDSASYRISNAIGHIILPKSVLEASESLKVSVYKPSGN